MKSFYDFIRKRTAALTVAALFPSNYIIKNALLSFLIELDRGGMNLYILQCRQKVLEDNRRSPGQQDGQCRALKPEQHHLAKGYFEIYGV